MGLDGIELIMEIERAFEISIPDQEAEKLITVGDIHNCVWNHIQNLHSNKCNSQAIFYQFRKTFAGMFGTDKNIIRTDTLINTIFPEEKRRENYFLFEKKMELELPPLVLPKIWRFLLNSLGAAFIGSGLIFAIIYSSFLNHSNWYYLLPFAGSALTVLLSIILNPKRTIISPDRMKAYVEKTLSLNALMYAKKNGLGRNEMEIIVNNIISEKTGLDLDEISPEKSFIDDLGLD